MCRGRHDVRAGGLPCRDLAGEPEQRVARRAEVTNRGDPRRQQARGGEAPLGQHRVLVVRHHLFQDPRIAGEGDVVVHVDQAWQHRAVAEIQHLDIAWLADVDRSPYRLDLSVGDQHRAVVDHAACTVDDPPRTQ